MPASKAVQEHLNKITKEELYQYFIVENHSTNETAAHFDIARGSVGNLCDKFGIVKSKEQINQKRKQTCLETYGVDSVTKVDKFKEESKKTCLQKYGVTNISQVDKVKEKKRKLAQEKYGVDCVLLAPEIKTRVKQTMIELYGVDNIFKTEAAKAKVSNKISGVNQYVKTLLGDEALLEAPIANYFFDIKYKDVLIEVDPYIWHNVCFNPRRDTSCDNYVERYDADIHYKKSQIAQDNGYRCIHIFDWMPLDETIEKIKTGNFQLIQKEVELHWWNPKTKDHQIQTNQNKEEMWKSGYYPIYDDGQLFC